ncbi:MAG: hypothetical protein LBO09_03435 [Candidatus Peribacteria bacterium]|jgi:4-hydroxy-tetrahydrodipicolinate reductase|nr:hypothetical protein [Candidatus Peribacteria bacterium]
MAQKILIVGLPGSMGTLTAERMLNSDGEYSTTGFGIGADSDNGKIITIKSGELLQDYLIFSFSKLTEWELGIIKEEQPIIIDFTHKDIIKSNWENYYKKWGCPLIVGTIGMKKEDFVGNTAPVIIGSPNLCPQIVEILRFFTELKPKSLKKWKFEIIESHQEGKTEPSGTGVRVKECLEKAGATEKTPMVSIRDKKEQLEMGVPKEYLNGHGWHTYEFFIKKNKYPLHDPSNFLRKITGDLCVHTYFTNKDFKEFWWENPSKTLILLICTKGSSVKLIHNVNGRQPYIDGLFKTVLPTMRHLINVGENSVLDMFDL